MNAQKNTNNILETETKLRQTVFDLMNGSLNLKEYPVPESNYVKNEYEEGKPCEKLYSEAFHLKQHLFDRLDSEDDEEVERLVDCLLEIGNITSMKMFDYGWYYAQKSLKLKSLQQKILR